MALLFSIFHFNQILYQNEKTILYLRKQLSDSYKEIDKNHRKIGKLKDLSTIK